MHRTPDHIRHFMVALTAPTFYDTIFDPACGTGGFLFDSFGYVLESISQDGHWPGAKAHPEMQAYFEKYFSKHSASMPSREKAISFYRTGIFGIEYLGMIRKMAAINLYIRGLNPQNIEQGDALAMFKPEEHAGGRSILLANPPFGAERDQEAYPNVWEEFSRESETTILFVKLMLDALAHGGRCAVIVSEGFLTWDQTSARTLRKMLLEEANLKAIISLPQGVFVSKGGIGPKTSILFFEKSGPTKEVWFYKVTNDGYTMGANRSSIEGCQLVEALDLFDKYIRNGKTAPDTKHSFTVPAEWILTLDPRVKIRIQEETTEEFSKKAAKGRESLSERLGEQLKLSKIMESESDERLTQHEEIWKNKTLNEIAKRIERAHLYSFNLPNYGSNFSKSQINEWNTVFKGVEQRNGQSLDDRFATLRNISLKNAHAALALFDVRNGMEFDIVRQFLVSHPFEELEKYNPLATLHKIIESGAKYPRVRLGEYLQLSNDQVNPCDFPDTRFRLLGVSNTYGVFLNETKLGSEIKQTYYYVKPNEFCYNPYRVNVGSIGLCEFDYDNQIISGAYNVFGTNETELLPQFLMILFKSPQFLDYVNEKAHGGVRMNFKFEYLENWEVPLPDTLEQAELCKMISKHIRVQSLIDQLSPEVSLSMPDIREQELRPLGEAVIETRNGWSPPCNGGDIPVLTLSCLKNGHIDLSERKYTSETRKDISAFFVLEGDFFYSRGNTPELVAIAGIAGPVDENIVYPDLLTRVVFDKTKVLPEYAVILFNSDFGRHYFGRVPQGASPSMVKVSQEYMKQFRVPYIGDIVKQRQIIDASRHTLEALIALDRLKGQAQQIFLRNIDSIWR